MTTKLYGNINTLKQNNNWSVNNRPTVVQDISVNTPSYKNRKTLVATISKYLKVRNGFDRGLWQPPLVARLPSGKLLLFDGDHRRALWKYAYPNLQTMPAQIIDVKNLQEVSALFVVINKTGRKSLSSDEVFVHEVLSNDPAAIATEKVLSACHLSVSLGTGEPGSIVGSLRGLHSPKPVTVRITGFKNTLRQTDKMAVKMAAACLQRIYPNETSLNHELLAGLSYIFHNCDLSGNLKQCLDSMEDMFKTSAQVFTTQNKLSGQFKKNGGSLVNLDEKCVAYGILQQLRTHAGANSSNPTVFSKPTFRKYFGKYTTQLKNELK